MGKSSPHKGVDYTTLVLLRALTIPLEALAKIFRFHVHLGVKAVNDLLHFAPLTHKVEGGVRDECIPQDVEVLFFIHPDEGVVDMSVVDGREHR